MRSTIQSERNQWFLIVSIHSCNSAQGVSQTFIEVTHVPNQINRTKTLDTIFHISINKIYLLLSSQKYLAILDSLVSHSSVKDRLSDIGPMYVNWMLEFWRTLLQINLQYFTFHLNLFKIARPIHIQRLFSVISWQITQ